jgi:hypothetical protein
MPESRIGVAPVSGADAVDAWRRHAPGDNTPYRVDTLKGPHDRKAVFRLVGAGRARTDIIAKWYRASKGRLERDVYQHVLPHVRAASPLYHGLLEDENASSCWLFVEDVGGEPYVADVEEHRRLALFVEDVGGEPYVADVEEHRRLAGQWLGRLHTAVVHVDAALDLPERGSGYYRQRLRSARDTIVAQRGNGALTLAELAVIDDIVAQCELVDAQWDVVEALCARMPRTIVHGDFVAKNLRLRGLGSARTVIPFDWSCAGRAPAGVDLAHSPLPSRGFSARPDLVAYRDAVRRHWPTPDVDVLEQWAAVGTLFRSLVAMCWEAESLASNHVDEPMLRMAFYAETLAQSARATGLRARTAGDDGRSALSVVTRSDGQQHVRVSHEPTR